jgi:hypothetical protein
MPNVRGELETNDSVLDSNRNADPKTNTHVLVDVMFLTVLFTKFYGNAFVLFLSSSNASRDIDLKRSCSIVMPVEMKFFSRKYIYILTCIIRTNTFFCGTIVLHFPKKVCRSFSRNAEEYSLESR